MWILTSPLSHSEVLKALAINAVDTQGIDLFDIAELVDLVEATIKSQFQTYLETTAQSAEGSSYTIDTFSIKTRDNFTISIKLGITFVKQGFNAEKYDALYGDLAAKNAIAPLLARFSQVIEGAKTPKAVFFAKQSAALPPKHPLLQMYAARNKSTTLQELAAANSLATKALSTIKSDDYEEEELIKYENVNEKYESDVESGRLSSTSTVCATPSPRHEDDSKRSLRNIDMPRKFIPSY